MCAGTFRKNGSSQRRDWAHCSSHWWCSSIDPKPIPSCWRVWAGSRFSVGLSWQCLLHECTAASTTCSSKRGCREHQCLPVQAGGVFHLLLSAAERCMRCRTFSLSAVSIRLRNCGCLLNHLRSSRLVTNVAETRVKAVAVSPYSL